MAATPIGWSLRLPGLQIRLNSSSLGPLKQCPRRYYYEVVLGLEQGPPSIDLQFGTLVHDAREHYGLARANGQGHDEALRATLLAAQSWTWDNRLDRPWQSSDPNKNRLTLLQTVVWYLDHWRDSPNYKTLELPSGRPALELKFEFDSGQSVGGEPIQLVGKLDEITRVESLGALYVMDCKTTKMSLSKLYVSQYTPHNQFSLYALAGQVCFQQEIKGVVLDAIEVGPHDSRFMRLPIPRSEDSLDEWLEDTQHYIELMGRYAEAQRWPQNDMSCGLFGGCPWREICGTSPRSRKFALRGLRRRAHHTRSPLAEEHLG